VSAPVAPTTLLSNTTTDRLQTGKIADKVVALLLVLPKLGKATPDILYAILDPLGGKDIPKARGGDDAASEDSPWGPSPAADLGALVAVLSQSQPSLRRGHATRQVVSSPGNDTGSSDPAPQPCSSP
jgi:hypothetical protein